MAGKSVNALRRWFDVLLCILDSRAHESYPAKRMERTLTASSVCSVDVPLREVAPVVVVAEAPTSSSYASFAAAVASGDTWTDGQDIKAGSTWYRYFAAAANYAGGLVPKYPFGDARAVTAVAVIDDGIRNGQDPRDTGWTAQSFGAEFDDWNVSDNSGVTRFERSGTGAAFIATSDDTISSSDVAVLSVLYGVTVTNSMTALLAWWWGGNCYVSAGTVGNGGAFVSPSTSASNWCHRIGTSSYEDSGIPFASGDTLYCATDTSTARIFSVSAESGDNASTVNTTSDSYTAVIGLGYPIGSGSVTVDVTAAALLRLTLSS